ncbi:MAG: hypothetical protein JW876_06345 [Candidatus Krumholzibacteriota bacterium]|nr:hypothetical protein [Candidatus Krumholzibacteriota bacterium]
MTTRIRGIAPCLLLVSLFAGCGDQEIGSVRLDRTITIDGSAADWTGVVTYLERETMTVMRFANDDRFLYILVSSSDVTMQRRVLAAGMTVWFDPDGGGDKTFGIAYPRKMPMAMAGAAPGMPGTDPRAVPGTGDAASGGARDDAAGDGEGRGRAGGAGMIERLMRDRRDDLDILGPAKDACLLATVDEAAAYGIEAMIGYENRALVCELRIPLAGIGGSPYAIGVPEDAAVGVTIATGRMERPAGGMGARPGGGMGEDMGEPPGGGMGGRPGGGMGGRPGGGMGGRPGDDAGGGMQASAKPFSFHAKLILAGASGEATGKKR